MDTICWKPSQNKIDNSNMVLFMDYLRKNLGIYISSYEELYSWSIENPETFWEILWHFFDIKVDTPFSKVVDDITHMPGAKWFIDCKLNFAENLLQYRDEKVALTFIGEGRKAIHVTYRELYKKVCQLAKALREEGIQKGDRISGFVSNQIETVIAMLATTTIGAIWSSCSPDFGIEGVYDRFSQIQPKILFAVTGYQYNGKVFDSIEKIETVVNRISSIQKIITIPYHQIKPLPNPKWTDINSFFSKQPNKDIEFEQVSADHPAFILYSSGTTGVPKCIVHSVGGTLIQHLKELILHTNLKRNDVIFYYTTCGWMMWNWLISSLAVGARIVLYDGNPMYPFKDSLWHIAEKERISIFGTSAKYLATIEKEKICLTQKNLSSLNTILSTGSALSEESFDYVYKHLKKDVQLSSISGGTDIISCFALGNPLLPVYRGEIQCRGLGMKVEAYTSDRQPVLDEKGELVCTLAAPSMPVSFWNDDSMEKYKQAYFSIFPGVWYHGDYIKISSNSGGVIIYGRSDTTLNPGGVRIGSAEIYRQVESIDEVMDSLVIGYKTPSDEEVILFVILRPGITLTNDLITTIKVRIKSNTTPRHVPSRIIAAPDLPYTISGKKVELAVKKLIHKEEVDNGDALANPQSLEFFRKLNVSDVVNHSHITGKNS